MELFKFTPGADPTDLTQGIPINGITSATWTERYRDPGEFEIVGALSSGFVDFLPLGTIISHTNTLDAMIVENQNIKEDDGQDPEISITGRSLSSILEDRIVGSNLIGAGGVISPYALAANATAVQARDLINEHISSPTDPDDALANFDCWTDITTGTSEAREIGRDPLLNTVLDLLTIDNLGLKTIRKNTFGGIGNDTTTYFVIHKGADKSASVIFSWKAGDLEGAEYLWSNRKYANSVLVVGRYVNVKVHTPGKTGYNRSTSVVKADDIDGHLDTVPVGTVLTDIIAKMQVRGRAVIANENRINLIRSDITELSKYAYRRDYNIGDIVTVDGNFGVIAPMRVVEYVEIMDENQETGHPTFETPNHVL